MHLQRRPSGPSTCEPLTGQVVAITGAARGIGYATARALIADGARVAIGVNGSSPGRAAQTLGRSLGSDRMFLDGVDHGQRRAYDERAHTS